MDLPRGPSFCGVGAGREFMWNALYPTNGLGSDPESNGACHF